MKPFKRFNYFGSVGTVIPEEITALRQFLFGCHGREDFLARVGMIARIIYFGRDGHGRRSEILHLLEMEIKLFCLGGELGHIDLSASRMTRYKIWYELLTQTEAVVGAVENRLEIIEEPERWLAHDLKDRVAGVFRRHFKTSRYMIGNQLFVITAVGLVDCAVAGVVHRQVIADAAADKGLLDPADSVGGVIDVEQRAVVGVEILARDGMETRRTETAGADAAVDAAHAVHIRRRAAKVADIALEIRHSGHLLYFAQYRFF